jgi:hypothetical protein
MLTSTPAKNTCLNHISPFLFPVRWFLYILKTGCSFGHAQPLFCFSRPNDPENYPHDGYRTQPLQQGTKNRAGLIPSTGFFSRCDHSVSPRGSSSLPPPGLLGQKYNRDYTPQPYWQRCHVPPAVQKPKPLIPPPRGLKRH